jgi:uncharacterized protein
MQKKERSIFAVKRSRAGLGLFTLVPWKRGATVIEYVGRRISAAEGDRLGNSYTFSLSKRFDLDGSIRSNTARYINHSCRPNCEAINRRGRIFIVARRAIAAGEELSYHYGKDFFEGFIRPKGCRCTQCQRR